MPMVFIQNPLRLADELGFSGVRSDKPASYLGDPTPEEVVEYILSRPPSQHDEQKARRRRKSKRIRARKPAV